MECLVIWCRVAYTIEMGVRTKLSSLKLAGSYVGKTGTVAAWRNKIDSRELNAFVGPTRFLLAMVDVYSFTDHSVFLIRARVRSRKFNVLYLEDLRVYIYNSELLSRHGSSKM